MRGGSQRHSQTLNCNEHFCAVRLDGGSVGLLFGDEVCLYDMVLSIQWSRSGLDLWARRRDISHAGRLQLWLRGGLFFAAGPEKLVVIAAESLCSANRSRGI